MILGELGFLGVFIGGGLAAEGEWSPAVIYYDIPEWSVMLADSWRGFRSFPWMSLYPALAFFVAILGFTLLGMGIRDLTERLTLSMRTLFNRYTFITSVLIVLGVRTVVRSNSLYAQYTPAARQVDATRAIADIKHLAGEDYNGRLSGMSDAAEVAQWIAKVFEDLGLQPAGDSLDDYFQARTVYYRDLMGTPSLEFVGPDGQ